MAKTAAERQRKRREKLKLSVIELQEYRRRDEDRKKLSRDTMTKAQLKAIRKRGKIATRKWRFKLATALKTADHTPETPHTSCGSSESCIYPYKSAASFGKAKRKVEYSLPRSPRKRTAVLARLSASLQPVTKRNQTCEYVSQLMIELTKQLSTISISYTTWGLPKTIKHSE